MAATFISPSTYSDGACGSGTGFRRNRRKRNRSPSSSCSETSYASGSSSFDDLWGIGYICSPLPWGADSDHEVDTFAIDDDTLYEQQRYVGYETALATNSEWTSDEISDVERPNVNPNLWERGFKRMEVREMKKQNKAGNGGYQYQLLVTDDSSNSSLSLPNNEEGKATCSLLTVSDSNAAKASSTTNESMFAPGKSISVPSNNTKETQAEPGTSQIIHCSSDEVEEVMETYISSDQPNSQSLIDPNISSLQERSLKSDIGSDTSPSDTMSPSPDFLEPFSQSPRIDTALTSSTNSSTLPKTNISSKRPLLKRSSSMFTTKPSSSKSGLESCEPPSKLFRSLSSETSIDSIGNTYISKHGNSFTSQHPIPFSVSSALTFAQNTTPIAAASINSSRVSRTMASTSASRTMVSTSISRTNLHGPRSQHAILEDFDDMSWMDEIPDYPIETISPTELRAMTQIVDRRTGEVVGYFSGPGRRSMSGTQTASTVTLPTVSRSSGTNADTNEDVPSWLLEIDEGNEADRETDEDDSNDPEIPWEDRWACQFCFHKNHPMTSRCLKCWTLRSQHFSLSRPSLSNTSCTSLIQGSSNIIQTLANSVDSGIESSLSQELARTSSLSENSLLSPRESTDVSSPQCSSSTSKLLSPNQSSRLFQSAESNKILSNTEDIREPQSALKPPESILTSEGINPLLSTTERTTFSTAKPIKASGTSVSPSNSAGQESERTANSYQPEISKSSNTPQVAGIMDQHRSALENKCVICLDKPRDASLIHGHTAHLVCCYECAIIQKATSNSCPVCRRRIQHVVKNFF